jgi:hypothetical protein
MPISHGLERIAWAILLISCVIFFALCALGTSALYSFFFQSTIPMTVTTQASRGALGITGADLREEVVREERVLSVGYTVRPSDPESQGAITLRDPYRDGLFVASIALAGESSAASVRMAVRPRFEWSATGYFVSVAGVSGRIEVILAQALPYGIALELRAVSGARVTLSTPGRYRIEARDGEILVESHGGTAVLTPPNQSINLFISGESTSIYSFADQSLRAIPPQAELLQNVRFTETLPTSDDSPGTTPLGWACSHANEQANAPRGLFNTLIQDGRPVLRLVRADGATSNGETICQQGLTRGEAWKDISSVDQLSIQAAIYIESQSLPQCGVAGSECPLMIRLDYLTADGRQGELIYGFYTSPDPSGTYPNTCPSCRGPHTRIQARTWYTFDSGNILAAFPPEDRPIMLSRVRFYASGHQYDTRISRFELLASDSLIRSQTQ